ncbi:MAG: hypothetical protein HC919_01065 [Oscillatoriales cyanobacterium SM2_2_1]|nr:hypothetical protein [Oscillatoriales cyanobacterium SM2_2_1]
MPVGSDYVLEGIDLRLQSYNTAVGDVALLQLFEDTALTSTNPNGATVQSLIFTNPPSNSNGSAIFAFTPDPTTPFTFRASTRYWLLLDATAGGFSSAVDSKSYSSDIGVTPFGGAFSNDNGTSYSSNSNRLGLRIRVVPFAFDGGLSLVALGGLGWLTIRRKKVVKASDPRGVS